MFYYIQHLDMTAWVDYRCCEILRQNGDRQIVFFHFSRDV